MSHVLSSLHSTCPEGAPVLLSELPEGGVLLLCPVGGAVSVEVSPWDPQMGEHAITLTPPPRGGSFGKLMLRF